MAKVFAIYPTDKQQSTKFLNKINTFLSRNLTTQWHCYKVKFTDLDHLQSIEKAQSSDAKLIIFMGHGRSNSLYGSCGKKSNFLANTEATSVNEEYYSNENFICANNIERFSNKIFLSFSCNSNRNDKSSIGNIAIDKGVLTFIGFGDVQTDFMKAMNNEYLDTQILPKRAIAIFKYIITKIIKKSLLLSIRNKYSVQSLVEIIKINSNKEIQSLILSKNKNIHKSIIVNHLYRFKNEIEIFGNRFEIIE